MRIGPSLVAALLVALVTTVAACKQPAPPPPAPIAAITITAEDAVAVRQTTLETGPRVSGTLEARARAVVRAEVGGQVVAVGPELGEPVEKGALLARIEAKTLGDGVRSAQAGVGSAQAAYDVAKKEADRAEALVKGGALAARELERARSAVALASAQLSQARAMVAGAKNQLGDTNVRAPITGVVAARQVSVGDIVAPGAPLYDLIVPSTMRLSAAVSSADLSLVAIGRPVRFVVRGYPGRASTARSRGSRRPPTR
jgi:RND family efflux transporter MFP subunit